MVNMDQDERMDYLIERLKAESYQYRNLWAEKEERPKLLRALMNVRLPRSIDNDYLRVQADYLKEAAREKGIVRVEDIPTVEEEYGSSHPFAGMLSIWQGDITRIAADAIVNAANSQLLGCFIPCHKCIDNAIHSAAGIELRMECDAIMKAKRRPYGSRYEEPTGRAEITGGYNLPAKHVIHTVGPIVKNKLNHALRQQLADCYRNVMECAMIRDVRTLAFCCISTGEFRFPNDVAAKIAVKTVEEVLEKQAKYFERIIFNVFQEKDLGYYRKILIK